MSDHREQLKQIKTFPSLVRFLRDELDWPVETDDFEELTFEYTPEELGIDPASAAKIEEIKRLRPLVTNQPWGIFFVKFEPKQLPVVALRRILAGVVVKKRATASADEQPKWAEDDLLFISNYGDGDDRKISFAHFSRDPAKNDLPTLKVIAWDELDTPLHLDHTANVLVERLSWPETTAEWDDETWRERWRSAFELEHREVITTARRLAERLAELARRIRAEIGRVLEIETEDGKVTRLMTAFRETLVHDLDADGFADMYAQTIAYGLLSARVTDPRRTSAGDLAAQMPVTNPFLKELLETFLEAGGRHGGAGIDFDELGVGVIVELLDDANMEAVLRDFMDRNVQEDPVIHFYEDFLKAYDHSLWKGRGVVYTPAAVVTHIVRSVDHLLRDEFGLADGLADSSTWDEVSRREGGPDIPDGVPPEQAFIRILDPATGTGTFLVEVIDVIHTTMQQKWESQRRTSAEIDRLWNEYVPEHLLPRLHAYELLMAPYTIAHLKVGLKLVQTGYRFESDQRAQIYLANALEPAGDAGQLQLEGLLPALAHEAWAVNDVKRTQRFTVVLGNPPYAGHSLNNQVQWIVDKVYDFKRGYPDLKKPGQAKWLQDDYVKFLRLAEWHVERSGSGLVGFITNHAWLDNPTFKGMRKHFLTTFDRLGVLDLHGNANKKEVAPDGSLDENVFEIKQGVAISLLRRTRGSRTLASSESVIERGDLFGTEAAKSDALRAAAVPMAEFRPLPPELVFAQLDADRKNEYEAFVRLPEIMNQNGDPAPGIVTTHDEFAISFTRDEQVEKVETLLGTETEAEAREHFKLCSQDQWKYAEAKKALRVEKWRNHLVPILYRPFDRRWTVYSRHVAVHRRERVSKHMLNGDNVALATTRSTEINRGWEHIYASGELIQHHTVSLKEVNYLFPLWLEPEWAGAERRANVSRAAYERVAESSRLAWLPMSAASGTDPDLAGRGDLRSSFGPRDLFDYMYAVLHSTTYRTRYREFLRSDFARIPLTPTESVLAALVPLGAELVSLHLLRSPRLDGLDASFVGGSGPTVGRVAWADGAVWLDAPSRKTSQAQKPGTMGFLSVPEEAWQFHIGGYQVCHKWLKDRKDRVLSDGEIAQYRKIVVAVTQTIRLISETDDVIDEHGGWPGAFLGTSAERSTEAASATVAGTV